jgi:hypothetical protein
MSSSEGSTGSELTVGPMDDALRFDAIVTQLQTSEVVVIFTCHVAMVGIEMLGQEWLSTAINDDEEVSLFWRQHKPCCCG